jgi:single-strand DNA-binding protein
MANLNKVLLMGNLTRDPELRYTPSGQPVCDFGMAINRTYATREGERKEETCFVDVTMWGKRGVVISEYFTKGRPIFIEGRLQLDTWEAADGRRSKLKVIAENFEFIGGRGPDSTGDRDRPSGRQAPAPPASEEPAGLPDGDSDVTDDEIPF